MLNIFTLANGRLAQAEIEAVADLEKFRPIWVDLQAPTLEEKQWVAQYYGLQIPDDATGDDIEESARFYEEENGELHIRADFLIDDDDDAPRTTRVAFILNLVNDDLRSRNVLFSIHEEDIPVFRLLRMRARRMPGLIEDSRDVLLKLFEGDAEYAADTLEGVHNELERVSAQVLKGDISDEVAGEVLATIARQENLNGLLRKGVMDTRRALSFMMRSKMLTAQQFEEARQIVRDIESLDSHTAFIFDKINFLMDATVGFININQNKIIKIFSVASAALLPPTLVASVYGMNMQIPEVAALGALSYPFVIVLMLISAILPMLYFYRKGWLR